MGESGPWQAFSGERQEEPRRGLTCMDTVASVPAPLLLDVQTRMRHLTGLVRGLLPTLGFFGGLAVRCTYEAFSKRYRKANCEAKGGGEG